MPVFLSVHRSSCAARDLDFVGFTHTDNKLGLLTDISFAAFTRAVKPPKIIANAKSRTSARLILETKPITLRLKIYSVDIVL